MRIEQINRILVDFLRTNVQHPDGVTTKWIYIDYPRPDATFPRISVAQTGLSVSPAGIGERACDNTKGEWQDTVYDIDIWVKKGNSYEINSLLTVNALVGQKDCVVANGYLFAVGETVTISDDNNSEQNEIYTISGNTLTMVNNLANTYTIADNGKVAYYHNRAGTALRDWIGDQVHQAMVNGKSYLCENEEIYDVKIINTLTVPYMDANELFRRTVTIRLTYFRTKVDNP